MLSGSANTEALMGVVSCLLHGEQTDRRLQPGDQEGTLKAALCLRELSTASLCYSLGAL